MEKKKKLERRDFVEYSFDKKRESFKDLIVHNNDGLEWKREVEKLLKALSPYPICHDTNCPQPLNFSEYAYTEMAGAVYVYTLNVEINCRLIEAAYNESQQENFIFDYKDKYKLEKVTPREEIKKVVFLPGHNLFHLISKEVLSRIMFEDDDVLIKLHPISDDKMTDLMGRFYGFNKILDKKFSGTDLMLMADTIYTTTSSELGVLANMYGKKVINISNFFEENLGTYYPFYRLIFKGKEKVLPKVAGCAFSGIIQKDSPNKEQLIKNFFEKTQELRKMYKPITPPLPRPPKPPIKEKE